MTPPRDLGRYEPVERVTLSSLDQRLSNVERLLLQIQANQTPRWLKVGSWTTIVGSILGVAVKVLLEK